MKAIGSWTADLVSLLFPADCAGCGVPLLRNEQEICTDCLSKLPFTSHQHYGANEVERLFWGRVPLRAGMALMNFSKGTRVQTLLHAIKYKGRADLGVCLGRMLGKYLLESDRFPVVQKVVPVPLHPQKERMRGYNQSEMIARGLAEAIGVAIRPQDLVRNFRSDSQTGRGRFDRWANVRGRFSLRSPHRLRNAHVLLVDDVVTTGATLESCAEALQVGGNCSVSVATLACS